MSKRSDNQPEPIVPIRSKTPIIASILAEKIGLTPKSPQNVTKCGIKPMLDTPQMKNANVTIQNRSDPRGRQEGVDTNGEDMA